MLLRRVDRSARMRFVCGHKIYWQSLTSEKKLLRLSARKSLSTYVNMDVRSVNVPRAVSFAGACIDDPLGSLEEVSFVLLF